MEEVLKTTRFIHRLIVAVSAAILTFALAPDLYQRYNDAAEDARALQNLDLARGFAKYAAEKVDETANEWGIGQAIRDVVKAEGFALPSQDAFTRGSDVLPYSDELPVQVEEETPILNRARTQLTVGEIFQLLSEAGPVRVFKPQDESFRQQLGACLQEATRDKDKPLSSLINRGSGGHHFVTSIKLEAHDWEARSAILSVEIDDEAGRSIEDTKKISVEGTVVELPGFRLWLEKQPGALTVIDWPNELPRLSKVRQYVEDEQLGDAVRILREKAYDNRRTLTLGSVSLQGEMALALGAAAMLAVLLYFLAHLQHLVRMHSRCDYLREAKVFPWMPLFPGGLSETLTLVSLGLIPLSSIAVLLWRSWDVSESVMPWFGTMAVLAVFVVLGFIGAEIKRLRAHLAGTSEDYLWIRALRWWRARRDVRTLSGRAGTRNGDRS